jgi:hypothetical protein
MIRRLTGEQRLRTSEKSTDLLLRSLIRPCEVCRCPSSIVILVIPASFFIIPALFFVIPALSRDPERTTELCKGRQSTLAPGSSPGMTNTRTVRIFKLHRAGSIVLACLSPLTAFRRLARPKVWSAAVATVRVSQSLLGFQPEALLAHPDLTSGHVDQLDQRGPYRL